MAFVSPADSDARLRNRVRGGGGASLCENISGRYRRARAHAAMLGAVGSTTPASAFETALCAVSLASASAFCVMRRDSRATTSICPLNATPYAPGDRSFLIRTAPFGCSLRVFRGTDCSTELFLVGTVAKIGM